MQGPRSRLAVRVREPRGRHHPGGSAGRPPESLHPILYTVLLQLLSHHVALLKGSNVEQLRNLAKSVTVE